MSHGITEKDTAWFYREPAWHGLGVVSKKRPKTAQEWLKVAGLDWTVQMEELIPLPTLALLLKQQPGATGKQLLAMASEHAIPDHRAAVRSDTRDTLGVPSTTYEPFQNHEAFAFLDSLLGATIPETAFSLWGGKQVGALTRLPKHIEVGGDEVRQYIYMRTRHDGTGALWVFPSDVRVVCANTDRAAVAQAGGSDSPLVYKIRHRGNKSQAIHDAREALKVTIDYGKQFKKFGDKLASQKMAERQLAKVLEQLWPTDDVVASTPRQRNARMASKEQVRDLFFRGDTQGNSPGTKWCAYNALTEFHQHDKLVRSSDDRVIAERRFIRSFEDPDGFQKTALKLVVAA